jgi:hypothetical protein
MDCGFDFSRKNMSSRKMENDKYAEAIITKAIMAIVVPARTNVSRGRIAFYSILKATREFDGRPYSATFVIGVYSNTRGSQSGRALVRCTDCTTQNDMSASREFSAADD